MTVTPLRVPAAEADDHSRCGVPFPTWGCDDPDCLLDRLTRCGRLLAARPADPVPLLAAAMRLLERLPGAPPETADRQPARVVRLAEARRRRHAAGRSTVRSGTGSRAATRPLAR